MEGTCQRLSLMLHWQTGNGSRRGRLRVSARSKLPCQDTGCKPLEDRSHNRRRTCKRGAVDTVRRREASSTLWIVTRCQHQLVAIVEGWNYLSSKVAHIGLGFDFKVKRWSNRSGWEARDNILQRGGPHLTWYPSSPVAA